LFTARFATVKLTCAPRLTRPFVRYDGVMDTAHQSALTIVIRNANGDVVKVDTYRDRPAAAPVPASPDPNPLVALFRASVARVRGKEQTPPLKAA
jgi:hypothetical protein